MSTKTSEISFKTSLISLAKFVRIIYQNRPTRDLNGSEGLLIRTLGEHKEGFYIGIYFDTRRNEWADAELRIAREACYKYSIDPTLDHLVEVGFKISDLILQKHILIEFKDKRPDRDFGHGIEKNYQEALQAIEIEIEALLKQAENLGISKKLIRDLGKVKYSVRSNDPVRKHKDLELEMGRRFVKQFKATEFENT